MLKTSVLRLLITLCAALLTAGSAALAQAQAQQITVMAHQVHEDAVKGPNGVDLTPELADQTDVSIEWQTIAWPDMHERVLRELALSRSNTSMIYVISEWMSPQLRSQLTPLNQFLEDEPIENFEGIPQGMLEFVTDADGQIYGIPFRAYGPVLFYNREILAENDIENPPESWEELLEQVSQVAGRRSNGARVYGIRFEPTTIIDWARAYGGDAISRDFEIKFTEEPMIRALNDVAELYEQGAIPPQFMNLVADDWLTLAQNGQVAFDMRGPTYFNNLNNPEVSQVAGKIGVTTVPASETIDAELVPGNVSFWSMTVPSNASKPEAAWDVIRFLSSDQAALQMAINGNAPTKTAVYDDPDFAAAAGPWLEPARESLAIAKPNWPAFDELARVQDIFFEQVALAVTGRKTPEQAMADAEAQIAPLLPSVNE